MEIKKIDAIFSLVPNADCALSGGVITVWNSEETQPTEEEITAEMERLQAEYDANEYQRNRAAEYPSVIDQLDIYITMVLMVGKQPLKRQKISIRRNNYEYYKCR